MQRFAILCTFWVSLLAAMVAPAAASNVVVDLDRNDIDVTITFGGTQLLLFGAVRPTDETTGLLMTIEGPPVDAMVRRKGRLLGLWFNLDSRVLEQVSSYFQVFATPGIDIAATAIMFQPELVPDVRLSERNLVQLDEWQQAYLDTAEAKELIVQDAQVLNWKSKTLFRASLDLPSNVSPGRYRVRVHELSSDRIIVSSTTYLEIRRAGLNANLFALAVDKPAYYGLLCVVLAVISGFGAARLLRR